MHDSLITVDQAAELLSVSRATVHRMLLANDYDDAIAAGNKSRRDVPTDVRPYLGSNFRAACASARASSGFLNPAFWHGANPVPHALRPNHALRRLRRVRHALRHALRHYRRRVFVAALFRPN